MALGLASIGMWVGSAPGSTRATRPWSGLGIQTLPLAKARPGPPWPSGQDPDAGMVCWTRLVPGSTTVTLPSRPLATQTDPPPLATAAGSVPTLTALTSS